MMVLFCRGMNESGTQKDCVRDREKGLIQEKIEIKKERGEIIKIGIVEQKTLRLDEFGEEITQRRFEANQLEMKTFSECTLRHERNTEENESFFRQITPFLPMCVKSLQITD